MSAVMITLQAPPSTRAIPLHSVKVKGTEEKAGQTAHYRNSCWSDLKGDFGRVTLPEMFESGLAQSRHLHFLGHRSVLTTEPLTYAEYAWQTYEQIDIRRKAVGSALHTHFQSGHLPKGPDFQAVGIWSVNRPEWQIVDLACHAYGCCEVSLYDTLGRDSVEYIINHSEIPIVFCSANHVHHLLDYSPRCPSLKMIVSFDEFDSASKAKFSAIGAERGVTVSQLNEFEAEGERNPAEPVKATLNQIATICYTSGTTSTPKGVVLTHNNLASAALGYIHGLINPPRNTIMFSYLPLAHSYQRCLELVQIATGARIGYFTGDPLNLLKDIQCLKPHIFLAVPRILNKIYQNVMANAYAPGLKGMLFRHAVQTKLNNLHVTGSTTHALWDRLVFKKVQAALGGNVIVIASGSAPISVTTLDFFKIAFGCDVVEGYGLTETCAAGTKSRPDDIGASGTVGGALMTNEVKLVDVEELSYKSTDKPNPRGEICMRGDNVFSRYYKDDENTAAAIDSDGWFHTGDIGEVDPMGRFRIIDRVKNIMKLSQGEYVALEKIENLYSACPPVVQVYVHGDSLQDYLVAVLVPDPVALAPIAAKAGHIFDPKSPQAFSAVIKEPDVVKAVLETITGHVRGSGNVKGFEVVKSIHLTTDQFTVDNDTLTPTFKIKRRNAYQLHKEAIDNLYRSNL